MKTNSKIIQNILAESLDVSINYEDDVFFEYSPHVEWIDVKIFSNGWQSGANPDYNIDINIYDTERLEELLEYVKSLKDAR